MTSPEFSTRTERMVRTTGRKVSGLTVTRDTHKKSDDLQKVAMPAKTKKRAKLGIHAPLPGTREVRGRAEGMIVA